MGEDGRPGPTYGIDEAGRPFSGDEGGSYLRGEVLQRPSGLLEDMLALAVRLQGGEELDGVLLQTRDERRPAR